MQNYDSSSAVAFGAILGVMLIPGIIIATIVIIAHWKIYTKAGKPGWAAIIPIYNIIVYSKLSANRFGGCS